jgi:mono/diheme cytochrome c family protein
VKGGRAALVAALGAAAAVAWLATPLLTAPRPREKLPAGFAGKRNPLAGGEAVAAGARIFQENCATCHGEHADGHGSAAVGLVPPPADFRTGVVLEQHSDAYLYYRLSTGKPGTAMPSFHGVLDEQERWQVITYLRSLGSTPAARP